jgi:hypothetical protein
VSKILFSGANASVIVFVRVGMIAVVMIVSFAMVVPAAYLVARCEKAAQVDTRVIPGR